MLAYTFENVHSEPLKHIHLSQMVVHTPLIPALGRQGQADLYEFKTSLIYRVNARTTRDVIKETVSKKQNKNKNPYTLGLVRLFGK